MPKLIFSSKEVHNRAHGTSAIFPVVKPGDPESGRYLDYLGDMLRADVGERDCPRLLKTLSDVESGKHGEVEHTGNEWITTINRGGVTITHQYVEDLQDEVQGHFTLQEVKTAVEAWGRFLAKMDDKSATVEVEL